MPAASDGGPPSNQVITSHCRGIAHTYAGRSFKESRTVRVSWLSIWPDSWQAGSHTATCMIGYYTTSGQLRSVSGDQLRPDPGVAA